jgi:hypothetical protein
MGIQLQGNGGTILEVEAATRAMRVTPRYVDYGSLGHYQISRRFAPAASTTAGNLWTFRWTDATRFAVLTLLRLKVIQVAAPTAAIEDIFNAKIARGYTLADTTGSGSIAPAASMQKMRTSMGNSLAEVRESSAAAGASGGTKTVDGDAFATGSVWVTAALGSLLYAPQTVLEYKPDMAAGECPIILAQNEGILVANTNSFGTASGIILHFQLAWAEVAAY